MRSSHSFIVVLTACLGARAQISLSVLSAAASALAPALAPSSGSSGLAQCSVASATLALPTAGDVEIMPGDVVESIALGVGTINYVCKDSAWTVDTVQANLLDISCQYNSSLSALSTTFNGLASSVVTLLTPGILGSLGTLKKTVTTAAGVALPELGTLSVDAAGLYTFDYRPTAGGSIAGSKGFAAGKVAATQPAPVASYNVPWLRINPTKGELAQDVFQVQTGGGIPLTSGLACVAGSTDAVPYSAQYWLYKSNNNATNTFKLVSECSKKIETTKPTKAIIILTQAVQYGTTGASCTSIEKCSAKCLALNNCVGFSLSTQDGQGYIKLRVLTNKLGYSPYFNSGIVRKLTNKEYVDRQGDIHACPTGQITAADYLGCVFPPTCN